jgi:hypothetical protein
MKFAQINDYLQTLATFGAIIGLLIVAYEVRETHSISVREMASANWTNVLDRRLSLLDSGVSATLEKSMMNPDELTLREKTDLNFYFESFVVQWSHTLATVWARDWREETAILDLQVLLSRQAPGVFGSKYARAWLQVNKTNILPMVYDPIDRGLRDAPLGSDRDYYERIDALTASMN